MAQPDYRQLVADTCIAHMVARVDETAPQRKPYPNFWTGGFFPPDIYEELLERMPPKEHFNGYAGKNSVHGKPARFIFKLLQCELDDLAPKDQQFWLGLRDALASPALKRAVFAKLSQGIAYQHRIDPRDAADLAAYPRVEVMKELPGYVITPHPDTRRKVVTMQICLARDDTQTDLGTTMYAINWNPLSLMRFKDGFARFRKVGQHPFLPNSVFAFAVVNGMKMRSWHGRAPLRSDCGERDSILAIYYRDRDDGNPEIVSDHYSEPAAA